MPSQPTTPPAPATSPVDQASTLRELAREHYARAANATESNAPAGQEGVVPGGPRVFTITSGKGGVGKTLVTANVALCLRRMGKRVLVLDADLGLANIDIVLGIETEYDLSHVISGERSLSEVIVEGPEGIRIIPAASGDENLANLDDNGRLNLVSQFEALESETDFLLIDSAAGISSNVIFFNLAAQSPIVVTTPEPTSITDAYAIIKVLSQDHHLTHFYLVVNRAKDEAEGQEVHQTLMRVSDRFLKSVAIEWLGFLPEDHRINRAIRSRQPVVLAYPRAPITQAIESLSRRIAALPVRDQSAGYPGFMRGRLWRQNG